MRPPAGAVIFDVDGVLLDLTLEEELAFFAPFKRRYGLTDLSRDWDSYRIRNDEDIIKEVIERYAGRPPTAEEYAAHCADYLEGLEQGYASGALTVKLIPGATELLNTLVRKEPLTLGTATANLIRAAEMRLTRVALWDPLRQHAHGADGGGAKRAVLARAIAWIGLPPSRIVYIGDNLNDVDAGLGNGVHFIGFALEEPRRERLRNAGAPVVSGDHATTLKLIEAALGAI